ncbi:YolD-like family protein [Solibacillus sp. FSL H8-0538]|uniref:YolD-like family protein n=1 Tax=Solibacillus sp. FSL H8-0538 TaxID=2921400 RepID=UPI0030F87BFD
MNRDRGTIKWNAMMLPEHVKLLREWQSEDKLVEKPELDEWALQELSEQLTHAYENALQVEMKIWETTAIYKVRGKIDKIQSEKQQLRLEDGRTFSFHRICGAALAD